MHAHLHLCTEWHVVCFYPPKKLLSEGHQLPGKKILQRVSCRTHVPKIQALALLHTSCVTLGQLHNPSVAECPWLDRGMPVSLEQDR